ncbi:MAG: hypothetical protein CTY18_05135 [Methylomonas sp.]|nr:MAG: hypothetical protein CTY24_05245 [Methylobacter sp.]PPD36224.1 MAG: hypothetical protein CTY18_05135 [Methylomonas sp.]
MDEFMSYYNLAIEKAYNVFPDVISSILANAIQYILLALLTSGVVVYKIIFKRQLGLVGASYLDKWTLYFGNVVRINNDTRVTAFEELPDQQYIYGDIESTLIVSEVFNSAFHKKPKYSRFFNGADKLENIVISVGGPKWNRITETLIGELGSPVQYEEGIKATILTENDVKNEFAYKEEKKGKCLHVNDVGVILVGKREALREKNGTNATSVCVVTGYSVYGVRLAAEYLKKLCAVKSEFKKIAKNKKLCILVVGRVEVNNSGEVTNWNFDDLKFIYDKGFLPPDLYTYSK